MRRIVPGGRAALHPSRGRAASARVRAANVARVPPGGSIVYRSGERSLRAAVYSGTRHVRQPRTVTHSRTDHGLADYRSRSAASPRGPPITPAVAAPTTARTPATVYDTGNRTAVGSYDAMRVPGYLLRLARARGGDTRVSYALNINLISPRLPVAE